MQLAGIVDKVSAKLASMAYGRILAEQVTMLRQPYVGCNHLVPLNLLHGLIVEGAVDVLSAVSQAQCDESVHARIIGTESVGHIMTLLIILCADDTEVMVEQVVIYSGCNKRIFLDVVAAKDQDGRYEPTKIRMERLLKETNVVHLPMADDPSQPVYGLTYPWEGYLATRLDFALLGYGSLQRRDVAADCCDFLWNSFQLCTSTDQHMSLYGQNLLGPESRQRMRKALRTMFQVNDWSPKDQKVELCITSLTRKLDMDAKCSGTHTATAPDLILHLRSHDDWLESQRCQNHSQLWDEIVDILADGFAGLFVDPSPRAAVVGPNASALGLAPFQNNMSPFPWTSTTELTCRLDRFGRDMFADHGVRGRSQTAKPYNVIAWAHSSSVLYPTIVAELRMPRSFSIQYQLTDGWFIVNEKYYDLIESGLDMQLKVAPNDPGTVREVGHTGALYPVPQAAVTVTVAEGVSDMRMRRAPALKLDLRAKISNHIHEFNLGLLCVQYELGMIYAQPCSHSDADPLDQSLMRRVGIPSNIITCVPKREDSQYDM